MAIVAIRKIRIQAVVRIVRRGIIGTVYNSLSTTSIQNSEAVESRIYHEASIFVLRDAAAHVCNRSFCECSGPKSGVLLHTGF